MQNEFTVRYCLCLFRLFFLHFGCEMNSTFNSQIGATPADITRHCIVNILVSRVFIFSQKDGGGHDLTGLAIAALRNIILQPCCL